VTDVNERATQDSAAPIDVVDPRLLIREQGVRGYLEVFRRRVRGGELGSLPVIVGLVIIFVVFQSLNDRFLSAANLSDLTLQIAATGVISVGIVLVLLLGEIDLSVGSVSGLSAAVLAVLNINQGMPAVLAVVLAVLVGTAIGLFHGYVFAIIGVPAFVVTLAGLIGWLGLQLYVLGKQGTINFPYNGGVAKLTHSELPAALGYALGVVVVGLYLLSALVYDRRRAAAGLPSRPVTETGLRVALLAIGVFVAIYVLNQAEGVPLAVVIFVGLVVVFDLILRKTRYGRSIFAVGGNVEAARRAGINVAWIRISVFMLCSSLAAFGGVLAASRLYAANQSSGGSDVLLNAIAAAVIGGTSLFGGRGSTYSALLGMLVIGSITNGMFLLDVDSSVRFMVTGAVLLAAVVLDSLSRRGRQASGRA